jgi:DNA-binding CsgD family transcriptional regulator/tetratricopeptide (TPR) repeat protein
MLVGRARETAAVDQLIADARSGSGRALVLRGEAGIGKSALLQHARANAGGFLILEAVGIESESELAFAGLHLLLHPVLGLLDRLPAPQAAGLRAAFALSDETVAERFRISVGALGLLAAAAEDRPVLCIVDDAQWLDDASDAALLFVARRLMAECVAILFAARDDAARPFDAPGVPDLRLEPLPSAEARLLATQRFGDAVAPSAMDWILENARGNPLALMELPQTLSSEQATGRERPPDILPVATSVERSYRDRLARLPAGVQEVLLVAAAEETGDRATITRAAAVLGFDAEQLSRADEDALITLELDRVAFRHPLVRSAVYRRASLTDRERVHRALADVLGAAGQSDRRAWHLAMSVSGTDEAAAAELEATAGRAQARAGYAGASKAFERAAELSATADDRGRRLVRAGRTAWQAGQRDRATRLMTAAGSVADPLLRGEQAHVFGQVELSCGSQAAAGSWLLDAADAVATHDPRMALEILLDAALAAGRSGNPGLYAEAGRRAMALQLTGDPTDEIRRALLLGVGDVTVAGNAAEVPQLRAAVARAQQLADPRALGWAAFGAATIGAPTTESALARSITAARVFGALPGLVLMLESMVVASHIAGRYSYAAEAEEGLRLAREAEFSAAATAFVAFLSWIAALQGQDDACRSYAAEVTAFSGNGMAMANTTAQWALALLDLSRGAADRTITRLVALRTAGVGEAHPLFVVMSVGDLVEAYVQVGQRAAAAEACAALNDFAIDSAPLWALGLAARCRGLLAEVDAAEEAFDQAVRLYGEANRPFDRARTELLYGSYLRRQRRRADARGHLRIAVEGFERLGAEAWAERARTELRATGETARKRDPSTITQLTPQELQIARLVASGNSNKDVATQLFLSPRTVEYHLAKVFTKLGISSRADLIRQSAVLEPAG